jgi:hypothetical protein
MACDRFVNWKKDKPRPTREEVELVIRDYFGSVATEVRWDHDRFFITLVGQQTHPLERVDPNHPVIAGLNHYRKLAEKGEADVGRWIEVWLGQDSLDVITRMADPLTNACAGDLVWYFSRHWDSEREEG